MSLLLNEYWLEFDGVDDYVQAQNNTDLDFALPIRIDLEFDSKIGFVLGKPLWSEANSRHQLSVRSSETDIKYITTNSDNTQNAALEYPKSSLNTGQRYEISIDEDGADLVLFIDSVEVDRITPGFTPGATTENPFRLGRSNGGIAEAFHGKMFNFTHGTETFPLNEGTGTTITGSEGTVLDIYGATWGGQPNKKIKDVYIEDSGVLRSVKNIYLGTSTGLKTVYQSEPTP